MGMGLMIENRIQNVNEMSSGAELHDASSVAHDDGGKYCEVECEGGGFVLGRRRPVGDRDR